MGLPQEPKHSEIRRGGTQDLEESANAAMILPMQSLDELRRSDVLDVIIPNEVALLVHDGTSDRMLVFDGSVGMSQDFEKLPNEAQRAQMRWERFTPVLNRWIPPTRVSAPYPGICWDRNRCHRAGAGQD